MGDVAEILGIGNRESGTRVAVAVAPAPAPATNPAAASSLKSSSSNKGTGLLNVNRSTTTSTTNTAFTKPVVDVLTSSKATEQSSAALPPIVPAPAMVRVNNRLILSNKKARPWCWAPFSSNARNDGLLLHHWVRAGVEYPEYPFARFNVHLDALNYKETDLNLNLDGNGDTNGDTCTGTGDTLTFYKGYLQDDNWTQSETDTLLELCRIYELRWPVIIDRWIGKFGSLSNKTVEDLQHRYYTIGMVMNRRLVEKAAKVEAENLAKALAASKGSGSGPAHGIGMAMESNDANANANANANAKDRQSLKAQHAIAVAISTSSSDAVSSMVGDVKANMQPPITATNTGTTNQPTFDLASERQRRRILEKIWDRSKEEELEEETLRAELKLVETQIRKLKKGGGHILAAAAAAGGAHASGAGGGSTVPTPASSRGPSPIPGSVAAIGIGVGDDASFAMLDSQFIKTAPVPTAGTPYLQSGRLVNPATGGQMAINKTTLKRMEQILKELNVNERPTPTKRVCDMYDHVRKGVLTLLTLQKAMFKNESEVLSRRNRLEKIAGAAVAREIQIKADAASAALAAAAKEKAAAEKVKVKPKAVSTKKAGGTTKKTTKKKAAGDKGTKRKKPTPKIPAAGTPATEGAAAAASTSTAAVKGDGDDSNPKKRAKVS